MDRTLARIAALVEGGDVETRCAALVVLTRLGSDDGAVVAAAEAALRAANVVVRDFAIGYLEATRPKTALPSVLPLLDSEDDALRKRAADLVAAYGAAAVAAVKKLVSDAPRRRLAAIVEVCTQVRTVAAYDLLFRLMAGGDFDVNRLIGDALERLVPALAGADREAFYKRVDGFATAMKNERVALVSALKLFGTLGDVRARKRLFALLGAEQPHAVRTHALGALVSCLRGQSLSAAEADTLLGLLDHDDEAGILRPAITLLEDQSFGRQHLDRLQRLAESPQASVKRFAVHVLGGVDSGAVTKTLIGYLTDTSFARREEAIAGLKKTPAARLALMKELLACDEERKAWTLADILLAHDRSWRKDVREQLWKRMQAAVDERDDRLYSAYLEFLRQLDEDNLLERIRARADQLRQRKKWREAARWYGLLRDSRGFDDEARYALAICDLCGRKQLSTAAPRRHDPALDQLRQLVPTAFPLADRLRKERVLGPEALFYVGFHLAEGQIPERVIAREILEHLSTKVSRTKVGKAAKNKLRLLGS